MAGYPLLIGAVNATDADVPDGVMLVILGLLGTNTSALVITRLSMPLTATATNNPLPYVTPYQLLSAAEVRLVHVIPSGLVITRLPEPENATATNKPLPYVTDCH